MSDKKPLTDYQTFLREKMPEILDKDEMDFSSFAANIERESASAQQVLFVQTKHSDLLPSDRDRRISPEALKAYLRAKPESSAVEGQQPDVIDVVPKDVAPPGTMLMSGLTLVCPPAFVKRELEALYADGAVRYQEELDAGNVWRARIVKVSVHFWLLWSVGGGFVSMVMSAALGRMKSRD